MGHLVPQHGFDLFARHRLQEPRGHRHEGRIAEGAGGERVRRAIVHRDFRHADAGLVGELAHGRDEPRRIGVLGAVDGLRAGRHLRHHFRDEERDERAAEADDAREDREHRDIEAASGEIAVDAEDRRGDAEHQHHGEVGGDEQEDAFHRSS